MPNPQLGRRETSDKDESRPETEAESGIGRGGGVGANNPPQSHVRHELHRAVTGTKEGRRTEVRESDEEADITAGCEAGKEAVEGRNKPRKSGEGVFEAEKTGANEGNGAGADTGERRGVGIDKRLEGAARAGAYGVGGGEGGG